MTRRLLTYSWKSVVQNRPSLWQHRMTWEHSPRRQLLGPLFYLSHYRKILTSMLQLTLWINQCAVSLKFLDLVTHQHTFFYFNYKVLIPSGKVLSYFLDAIMPFCIHFINYTCSSSTRAKAGYISCPHWTLQFKTKWVEGESVRWHSR